MDSCSLYSHFSITSANKHHAHSLTHSGGSGENRQFGIYCVWYSRSQGGSWPQGGPIKKLNRRELKALRWNSARSGFWSSAGEGCLDWSLSSKIMQIRRTEGDSLKYVSKQMIRNALISQSWFFANAQWFVFRISTPHFIVCISIAIKSKLPTFTTGPDFKEVEVGWLW